MTDIKFRKPLVKDAIAISKLVKENPPLDENSNYMYVLLCHHFSDTCVVAEDGSKIIGFLSGLIPPRNPDTLFVWQAAVDSNYRNMGIANKLVSCACNQAGSNIKYVEATVTSSNHASLKFLQNFANDLGTNFVKKPLFSTETLGNGHEDEDLVRIGPIQNSVQEVVA